MGCTWIAMRKKIVTTINNSLKWGKERSMQHNVKGRSWKWEIEKDILHENSQLLEEKANEPRKVWKLQLQLHNSHFMDPLFELSQTEHEIGHYSTTQYNNLIRNIILS